MTPVAVGDRNHRIFGFQIPWSHLVSERCVAIVNMRLPPPSRLAPTSFRQRRSSNISGVIRCLWRRESSLTSRGFSTREAFHAALLRGPGILGSSYLESQVRSFFFENLEFHQGVRMSGCFWIELPPLSKTDKAATTVVVAGSVTRQHREL